MARSPTPERRQPSKTPLKRLERTHLRRRLRAAQRGPAGCGLRDGRAHSLAALSAPATPPAALAPPPATPPDAAPLPGPRAGRGRGPGRGRDAQAQSVRTCPALGWAQRTAGWAGARQMGRSPEDYAGAVSPRPGLGRSGYAGAISHTRPCRGPPPSNRASAIRRTCLVSTSP